MSAAHFCTSNPCPICASRLSPWPGHAPWAAKPVPPEPRRYSAAVQDAQRVMASVVREWASHPDLFEAEVDVWVAYYARLYPKPHHRPEALHAADVLGHRLVALMQHARNIDDQEGTG